MTDSAPAAPLESGAAARTPYNRSRDVVVTIIVLVFGLGLAVLLTFFGVFLVFASDSCGSGCNLDLFQVGWMLAIFVPGVAWLIGLVWSIVLLSRGRRAWPLATSAVAAGLIGWIIAAVLVFISVQQ